MSRMLTDYGPHAPLLRNTAIKPSDLSCYSLCLLLCTTTSLADTLLSSVPKLKASGLNWMIFSLCFQNAVKTKGYWGHFDSTKLHLISTVATSPINDELVAMAQ